MVKTRKVGGIVLYSACDGLTGLRRFGNCEFFLICGDEDKNIGLAEDVIAQYTNTKRTNILINAFVESGTNVKFLESVMKSEDRSANIELRCIDEIALFCNHLIYNHPLYDTKGNGKDISVVIVGCGRTGMRMLKTVYWAGQIDGYSLKIRVYDRKAEKCRDRFYQQCPGLKEEKAIEFITANVDSASFEEELLKNSGDATYILVAMDNDQLNLTVADRLYQIYRRHFNFREERMPEIFARVRSQAKTDSLFYNASFLEERNIHLFGTTKSVFSDKTLFDTDLENLAFAVHLTYWDSLELDRHSEEYAQIRKNFRTGEYNRRSSMAVALHFPAKLCMCDKIESTGGNLLTPENLKIYAECVASDDDFRHRLAVAEHVRWNAFMLSEGYRPATAQQMHQYAEAVDSHKDDLSMVHPCITGWDELDALEEVYNATYGQSKEFKKYDKLIVEKLPEIWAVAQQMNGADENV